MRQSIVPGDIVIIVDDDDHDSQHPQRPSLGIDDLLDSDEVIISRLTDVDIMLVISSNSKGYFFVLVNDLLGYVNSLCVKRVR